jgi:aminoglycoside phosphotransferase (APT) family kinase protein
VDVIEDEVVLGGFAAWLRERDPAGAPEVVGHVRPSVGFSSETILVDVRRSEAGGPHDERLVLKLPPAGAGIFPTYDFALQARVQEAVAAAGIPAPAPVQVEHDDRWMGAPFLVMPAIDGHVVDEMPIRDRWLTKADPALSTTVHSRYITTIAAVHRLDWRAAQLDDVVPVRDNAAELAHWRAYLDWYAGGTVLVPALVDALDWCAANQPATEPELSLLWGDVRLGNVIFDDERAPVAVLDWEMATIGAPEHDLAWMLTLEATQAELFQRTVAGFFDHDAAVAQYEAAAGRPLSDLAWYEILAMVRSTAIMTRVAHLRDLAGEPERFPIADNPILGLLARRIAEAEAAR